MPIYEFFCDACGVQEDVYLAMAEYRKPQKCKKGHGMRKLIPLLGVGGDLDNLWTAKEQKDWRFATGKTFRNARDLDRWAAVNGKTVVEKGFKPKKPPVAEDHEIEKALDDHYTKNHNAGSVETRGRRNAGQAKNPIPSQRKAGRSRRRTG